MYNRIKYKQDEATILYCDLISLFYYKAGDTIDIVSRPRDESRREKRRKVKILQVFKEHVLLDFGKYKECRKKTDIMLHLCHIDGD